MPDHEEAVREAREGVLNEYEISHFAPMTALDAFEDAIRASERAKYAALVEAATTALRLIGIGDFRNGVTDPTGSLDEGDVRAWGIYSELSAALTALQSKEGTNE